jgi:hypothetical protein
MNRINTPGVIERVKNLFRGYNKLILGFNTFLPEGEGTLFSNYSSLSFYLFILFAFPPWRFLCLGYKIELTPEEQAFSHPGQSVGSSNIITSPNYGISGSNDPSGRQPSAQSSSGSLINQMTRLSESGAMRHGGESLLSPAEAAAMHGHQNMLLDGQTQGIWTAGETDSLQRRPGSTNLENVEQGGYTQDGAGYSNAGGLTGIGGAQPGGSYTGGQLSVSPPPQMQQAHAIHYVTKIRNRFATEQETYRCNSKLQCSLAHIIFIYCDSL